MTPEPPTTRMATELRETPRVAARLLAAEAAAFRALGHRLRSLDPRVVITCARGSSDHAAMYFKQLCETRLGVPVASVGPSVASLYYAPLKLAGAVILSVSQSGRSPDLVALQDHARAGGALAVAIVNQTDSPLAAGADAVLPLHAGTEGSVAATKTCLASCIAAAALVADWAGDVPLSTALIALPDALDASLRQDWRAALPVLNAASSAYVLGRGPGLAVAAEAALKLKETCAMHAEAFSGAEVMHGPLQLVRPGFPVIAFRQRDAAWDTMGAAVDRLRALGSRVLDVTCGGAPAVDTLPAAPTGHPALDPAAMLLSFYALTEELSRTRGLDPDHPSQLNKVTETL